MKVIVQVSNKVIDKGHCYTFSCKSYEVEPFKITRRPAGKHGSAKYRYHYLAHFIGFGDMLDIHKDSLSGKETSENINRKLNPKFNPKELDWTDNVATVNSISP